MKILLAKHGRGFLPGDEDADNLHKKLGAGELMTFEPVLIRSLPWHRMYFGICRSIGQNQDPPRDEDSIDHELRVLAGHYDVMHINGLEGVEVRIPKRIAFKKLDADGWAKLWPSLELAIREKFGDEYIGERAA
jgi:hypothetical protein